MNLKKLEEQIKEEKKKLEYKCELCKDKGYYQEYKHGAVHTCMKCLKEGRLNQI